MDVPLLAPSQQAFYNVFTMLYDKDIREPLFDYLEEYYGKIRILEEKRTGRSRADIVMVLYLYGIYRKQIVLNALLKSINHVL